MHTIDYDGPVAITRDIHWVGRHEHGLELHCNPYLLLDDDTAVLIDPGSIPDFPVVMRKIIDLTSPQLISLIVASHQDPDVCSNLAVVEDVIERPDLHTDTVVKQAIEVAKDLRDHGAANNRGQWQNMPASPACK